MQSRIFARILRRTAITVAAAGMLLEAGSFAMAQSYGGMSCNQLWYARNAIYAENGYCFKTSRAISVFGRGCFPPYGKLSNWEQQEIAKIQSWEGRRGC